MPQITVYVATLNASLALPPFQLGGISFTNYLNAAGGGAIQVVFDTSLYGPLPPTGPIGAPVNQQQLYVALGQLFAKLGPTPIPPVGLILAPRYAPNPSAEGFMFDTVSVMGAPFKARQGCALFIDPIGLAAGPSPAAFLERLAFQAVHELGHVLNLWHITPWEAGPNFMSAPPPALGIATYNFVGTHQKFLSNAAAPPAIAQFVLPGGSNFDMHGPLAPPWGGVPYAVGVKPSDLTLRVGISHKKFHAVEPVEIDMSLSLSQRAKGLKREIPEELDPGYTRLKLWITTPSGERRVYRPGVSYCPSGQTIRITKRKPFQRDISIFRSADGYTFGEPGKYFVEATVELAPGQMVKSNKVKFEVEELPPDSGQSLAALFRPDVAAFLRWKDTLPEKDLEDVLVAQASQSRVSTSALIHYALGRARTKVLENGTEISADERRRGRDHIVVALANRALGSHRTSKARKALKALSAV